MKLTFEVHFDSYTVQQMKFVTVVSLKFDVSSLFQMGGLTFNFITGYRSKHRHTDPILLGGSLLLHRPLFCRRCFLAHNRFHFSRG